MTLKVSNAPHLRAPDSNKTMFVDMLLVLVAILAMATFYYGVRVILLAITGMAVSYLTDIILIKIARKKIVGGDFSALITGLLIVLLMPATVPYWLIIITCIFAIAIVKHPFGGFGQNPFNPAAAAFAFSVLCWPSRVLNYPLPFHILDLFGDYTGILDKGTAFTLQGGGVPSTDVLEMLLGNFPGPMGASNVLIIGSCFLFLMLRKTTSWEITVPFIVTSGLFAFIFPRIQSSRLDSIMVELLSGSLLFVAVFIATEPVTSPKLRLSKLFYGVLCGLLTMLLRYFGAFPLGACFAVLLCNSVSSSLDDFSVMISKHVREFRRAKQSEN